jgi:hypothetical protein
MSDQIETFATASDVQGPPRSRQELFSKVNTQWLITEGVRSMLSKAQ